MNDTRYVIVSENDSNELKHYGVLGMKWGVRRNTKKLAESTKRYHRDGAGSASTWLGRIDYKTDRRRERDMRRLTYDAKAKEKAYANKISMLEGKKQTNMILKRVEKLKVKSEKVRKYAEEADNLMRGFHNLSRLRIQDIARDRILGTMATVEIDNL